jgi:hypothetical protein
MVWEGRTGLLKPDSNSAKGLFGSGGVVCLIGGCSNEKLCPIGVVSFGSDGLEIGLIVLVWEKPISNPPKFPKSMEKVFGYGFWVNEKPSILRLLAGCLSLGESSFF